MVGVVVVKDGEGISEAFRNQTGSGDHAEYIALEHRISDKTAFEGADLITTLEPCTTRKHGKEKKPCAKWIILRRIRKVWIGALDRNSDIRGVGETWLQNEGVHIGRFPDDLALEVLELNKAFFEHIASKPAIPPQELESMREEIGDRVGAFLESLQPEVNDYWDLHQGRFYKSSLRRLFWSKKKNQEAKRSFEDVKRGWLLISILKDIRTELDMPDLKDPSYWSNLGRLLLQAHECYLIPFNRDPASMTFVHASMQRVYENRDRWDISAETSYDRTGQPSTDGTLRSWMKLRRFPVGVAWKAFDTATKLDPNHYEGWLGKAKAELYRRKFVRSYRDLKKVIGLSSFDTSGQIIPAAQLDATDLVSTLEWLAKLIDIRYPTMAFDIIPQNLHTIQLDCVLQIAEISGSIHNVYDILVLLLRRPTARDSDEDKKRWQNLGETLRNLSQSPKSARMLGSYAKVMGKLGSMCLGRLDNVDKGEENGQDSD